MNLISRICNKLYRDINLYTYRKSIPTLVKEMRKKKRIRVLFMLSDVSLWKTEPLYLAMLEHPRFEPVLGTALVGAADMASESIRKYNSLIKFLQCKKYEYVEIFNDNILKINPDITFYQQPYSVMLHQAISYEQLTSNGKLVCDIRYSIHTLSIDKRHKYVVGDGLHDYSWLMFFENTLTACYGKLSKIKGRNIVVTGIPLQDSFVNNGHCENPWTNHDSKKRIIYAPHHSLPGENSLLDFSTFYEVAEIMLKLAKKYSDSVQFAFKPHPFLKKKLVNAWGREKTENYYRSWENLPNSQIVLGDYKGLFKYSDALIHDCGSFTVEYCYEKKPCMYLTKPENEKHHRDELNKFGQIAYDLHTHGILEQEIERFIINVIENKDIRKQEREDYYQDYLLPPNGKTACENIINAILGEEEYS